MPDDYYVSKYSGEEIDALLGGAGAGTVRYDAAQTLTDEQKTQARGNIGAAPSGYGLGGVPKLLTADDDINAWHGNGYYRWNSLSVPQNAPTLLRSDGTGMYMYEFGYAEGFTQVCGCAVDSSPGLICRQVFYAVPLQFGDWEYITPPMVAGVEYRTTKRIQQKPVFTKKISFNGLDASGVKAIFLGTDEAKAAWIVSAVLTDPDDTTSDANFISIPNHNDITIGILGRWISIKWTGDYSKYTDGTIVVEYVKEAI